MRRVKGPTMPRLFSTATWALRILEAATIFMALVIFPMFLMALMRCLTAGLQQTRAQRAQREPHRARLSHPARWRASHGLIASNAHLLGCLHAERPPLMSI